MNPIEIENIEIDLLLEAMYKKHGYDFRSYSRMSVKRRVLKVMEDKELKSISELTHKVLYDDNYFDTTLRALSINVTEMFRDPPFFEAVRDLVLPRLAKLDFFKVWHAGCSTGEEVYSMAILFQEAGLTDRYRIYATDMNKIVLKQAKDGIYPLEHMKLFTSNYQKSGGMGSFGDYYTTNHQSAIVANSLKRNIVFAEHNLATDGVFGEMDLIICRNVLIYFTRELQNRVVGLFADSLCAGGILCLGSKESMAFISKGKKFVPLSDKERIYARVNEELSDGEDERL
jgi:chemotaxis protein methyltransferase CheR